MLELNSVRRIGASGAMRAQRLREPMPEQIVVTPKDGQWLVTTRGVVLQRLPTAERAIRKAIRTASRFTSHQISAEVLLDEGGQPKSLWHPDKEAVAG